MHTPIVLKLQAHLSCGDAAWTESGGVHTGEWIDADGRACAVRAISRALTAADVLDARVGRAPASRVVLAFEGNATDVARRLAGRFGVELVDVMALPEPESVPVVEDIVETPAAPEFTEAPQLAEPEFLEVPLLQPPVADVLPIEAPVVIEPVAAESDVPVIFEPSMVVDLDAAPAVADVVEAEPVDVAPVEARAPLAEPESFVASEPEYAPPSATSWLDAARAAFSIPEVPVPRRSRAPAPVETPVVAAPAVETPVEERAVETLLEVAEALEQLPMAVADAGRIEDEPDHGAVSDTIERIFEGVFAAVHLHAGYAAPDVEPAEEAAPVEVPADIMSELVAEAAVEMPPAMVAPAPVEPVALSEMVGVLGLAQAFPPRVPVAEPDYELADALASAVPELPGEARLPWSAASAPERALPEVVLADQELARLPWMARVEEEILEERAAPVAPPRMPDWGLPWPRPQTAAPTDALSRQDPSLWRQRERVEELRGELNRAGASSFGAAPTDSTAPTSNWLARLSIERV